MNGTNFSTFTSVNSPDQLPDALHYAIGVLFIFIMLTAVSGNCVFLFVFLKSKTLRTPNYFLVSALCLGDVLISSMGIPMFIITNFSTYWIFGEIGCTIYGTLMTFLGFMQITLLSSIAFIRYIFVVKNKRVGTFAAKLIVLSCYGYAFVFALAPLFGWSRYVVEPQGTSCGPNWVGTDSMDVSYNIAIFVMCFLVPLSIILFSYAMIFLKIKRKRIHKKSEGYENHVNITIFLMIVAFIFSWSPYAALALYVIITKNNSIHLALTTVPVILAKSSSLWNPYIYFMRDTKFNVECRKMVPVLHYLRLWQVDAAKTKESINMCDSTSSPLTCQSSSSV